MKLQNLLSVLALLLLAACGGGGNNGDGDNNGLNAPAPTLNIAVKQIQLSWLSVDGADHYRVLYNPDGASGFSIVSDADNITDTHLDIEIPVHKFDWLSAQYLVEACDAGNTACVSSNNLTVNPADSIAAIGYVKASNTGTLDRFGFALALSGDGSTMAVGAYGEDSGTSGINTTPDEGSNQSGAVYVFRNTAGSWAQEAYIKASNPGGNDYFGYSVALNNDGSVLAVGAYREDSSTTGINTAPDELAENSGAVYIFERNNNSWDEQAYIKHSNVSVSSEDDFFGFDVTLSDDGTVLAVGAYGEDSSYPGINPPTNEISSLSGAAFVFRQTAGVWAQEAMIKSSSPDVSDLFGKALTLSGDGKTLAVGAPREDSDTTGVNSTPNENIADAGAVYLFRYDSDWSQQAYIKPSNPWSTDYFGNAMALSSDGNTLAVAAYYDDSSTTGINSTPDLDAATSGAAYVFRYTTQWAEEAYIKPFYTEEAARFGYDIALSADGNTLAVGSESEDQNGSGINSIPTDLIYDSGSAYLFDFETASGWVQSAYIKSKLTREGDSFGAALALSDDGNILAVGAFGEDSSTTGIDSAPDDMASSAGAVYLY